MARKLSEELLEKLAPKGEYANILNEVNKDKELSLEIRDGKAIIYYQKGKILTLSNKGIELLANGYYKKKYTTDDFKNKYPDKVIIEHPECYFEEVKSFVNEFGNRTEFTIQQLIASENTSIDNDYLVIDMEYQYEQKNVPKNERIDFTRVDLLAIEKESKDIILFELKQGTNALTGDCGVDEHIRKSNILAQNERCINAIRKDVETIINQKVILKILPEEAKSYIKKDANIKTMFIYVYTDEKEKETYMNLLKNKVPTIYFNFRYILRKPIK